MNIKTTVRVAKVNQQSQNALQSFVSEKHDIAWSEEIDKHLPMTGISHIIDLPERQLFKALSLEETHKYWKGESKDSLRKTYLTMGKEGCEVINNLFPESIDKPLDAMQFLLASSNAYDSWTKSTPVSYSELSMNTGKAFLEAFDVFEAFFPALQPYKSHRQVAGLVLKIANSVYVLNKQAENDLYKTELQGR